MGLFVKIKEIEEKSANLEIIFYHVSEEADSHQL